MAVNYSRTQTIAMDGVSYKNTFTSATDGIIQQSPTVTAPKSGTLTTYTDANTATLTMASGHGITTAAKFDLYWAGGYRYNCTAGTVSGQTVPFTGGTGSAIPPASTVVTAMVPQSFNFFFVWADIQALVASSQKFPYPVRSIIHFISDTSTEVAWPFVTLDGVNDYVWDTGIGGKPLLVVNQIVTIKISHDDTTSNQNILVNAMFAN